MLLRSLIINIVLGAVYISPGFYSTIGSGSVYASPASLIINIGTGSVYISHGSIFNYRFRFCVCFSGL